MSRRAKRPDALDHIRIALPPGGKAKLESVASSRGVRLSALIRDTLAEALSLPDLTAVNDPGRPWPEKKTRAGIGVFNDFGKNGIFIANGTSRGR